MTKKDFIALADAIIANDEDPFSIKFEEEHLEVLGDFCARQNPRFDWGKWKAYITERES